ncbi:MAG: hypothetical protein JXR19_00585 [Bacteroidia bacterium]
MEIKVRVKGGLANRMRALSSCINMHHEFGVPIQVHWENNKYLNCSFNRLFQPIQGVEIVEYPFLQPTQKIRKLVRRRHWQMMQKRCDYFYNDFMKDESIVENIKSNKKVFIYSCERFYGDANRISEIKPVPWISQLANKRRQEMGPDYVALHIRQGDNIKARAASPLGLFQSKIEELLKDNNKLFVASDSNHVLEQLHNQYGEQVYFNQHRENRSDPQSIEQALLDFLMLSSASKIYGSYWSSFSEEAANYRRISHEVLKT